MTCRALCLAALVACHAPAQTSTAVQHVGMACDPATYGAVPDDGISDRVAFQAALDAGGLCIGPGRWTMARAPVGSYNRFAALSTHGQHVAITGVGPATVLELGGDQGGGDVTVISVDPSATDVTISDLTISTARAVRTSEQTHAIATSGTCGPGMCRPITGLAIARVMFDHPPAPDGSRKGDCIRLLGNTPGTSVSDVTITGITDAVCARAFIELQRGLRGVEISGNATAFCGDTCLDSEPTGVGSDSGIRVTGNVFACAEGEASDTDITLGGITEPMSRVWVEGNRLCRGLATYRIADSTIRNNTIAGAMRGPAGVVDVRNVCAGLVIEDNVISRSGFAGPILRATPHSGGLCSGLTVRRNSMLQQTAAGAFVIESVSDVTFEDNAIQWAIPMPKAYGLYARATVAPLADLRATGNTFLGTLDAAIYLAASPYPISGVTIGGNTSTAGVECAGAGGFSKLDIAGLSPRRCP